MPPKQSNKHKKKSDGDHSSGDSQHDSDPEYGAKKPRVGKPKKQPDKPVKPPSTRTPVSPPSPPNPPVGSGAAGGAAPGSAASNAPAPVAVIAPLAPVVVVAAQAPAEARVDKGKSAADKKCNSQKCNRSTVDGNNFCCVKCWGNNQHTYECDLKTAQEKSLGIQVEEAEAKPKERSKFDMNKTLELWASFHVIQEWLVPPGLQKHFTMSKNIHGNEFLRYVTAAPKGQLFVLNLIAKENGFFHGTSLASAASMTRISVEAVKNGNPVDGGMTKKWNTGPATNGSMLGGGIYITDSLKMAQNYTSRGSQAPEQSDMCICFMKVTTRMTQENTLLIAESIHNNRSWRESFNKMLLEYGKEIRFVMLVTDEYWNARRLNTSQGISKVSQIVVRYAEDIQGIWNITPCNQQAVHQGGTCKSDYRIVGGQGMLKVVISHTEWHNLTDDQQEKLSKIAPEASLDSPAQSANGGSAASK